MAPDDQRLYGVTAHHDGPIEGPAARRFSSPSSIRRRTATPARSSAARRSKTLYDEHRALPEDLPRHLELLRVIDERLKLDPIDRVRAKAEFDPAPCRAVRWERR